MGLSGRKEKQRIGADPRNLSWADNAAKFGQTYLAKLGWDPARGLGLGVDGEGRTSHIKVVQKLNLLGIGAGAAAQRSGEGADGVAWKQNREYEMLLRRLNAVEEKEEEEEDRGKKKRKRGDEAEARAEEEEEEERRKKKKDKKDKKREKKQKKDEKARKATSENSEESTVSVIQAPAPTPRPMAHRARFLRSKQLASRSSTAVAEILGISGSGAATPSWTSTSDPTSSSSSGAATPSFLLVPPSSGSGSTTPSATAPVPDQELTTARTSVADHFKEKLAARARERERVGCGGALSSLSMTPGATVSESVGLAVAEVSNVEAEAPRVGLGSRSTPRSGPGGETEAGAGSGSGSGSGVKRFGSLMGGFTPSGVLSTGNGPEESVASPETVEALGDVRSRMGKEKRERKGKEGKEKKKKKRKGEVPVSEAKDAPAEEVDVAVEVSELDAGVALKEKIRREKAERKEKERRKEDEVVVT